MSKSKSSVSSIVVPSIFVIHLVNRAQFLKKLLTYFLCDNTWSENFSIIKLDFRGKRGFYLFFYNAFFKDRVLLK